MSQRPAQITYKDHLLAAFMSTAFVAWLLRGARGLGFARDEGFYFNASRQYAVWFERLLSPRGGAFERAAVDSAWAANHEHPGLVKGLFALSNIFLHRRFHIFDDESTAIRFVGMAFAGMAMWVTYLFGARVYSRRAGIAAAWLMVLAPNVFYNAHLACFDVPVMAMWVLCIYVYFRATTEGTLSWALAAGVVYGLTLDTKHNAWILPAVFLPHAFVAYSRRAGELKRRGTIPVPASLLSMATVGPAVFVALWPWLWNDTLPRFQEYVNFHVHHEYYHIEFLRKDYWAPPAPKLYAPVMILGTVPTITLLLMLVGVGDRLRINARRWLSTSWRRAFRRGSVSGAEPDLLFALGFGAALGPFFLANTPIFGGTKHWMTAYPFLALFAGRGFDVACDGLSSLAERLLPQRTALARSYAPLVAAVSVFAAPVIITGHSHPFGLSAYVPIVGGAAGAASLGLNRQFWGFTTQSVAPYFDTLPPGTTVYFHDTAWDSWAQLQSEGRVRKDLRGVPTAPDASVSLTHHELHMATQDVINWVAAGTPAPDTVIVHDGVPIVSVFRR